MLKLNKKIDKNNKNLKFFSISEESTQDLSARKEPHSPNFIKFQAGS
jgi:hypothetical protein